MFPICLLAISLSLDALGVGLVYGIKKIKIPLTSKLIICLFSIFYATLSLLLGKSLSYILTPTISKLVGVSILISMGLWLIIQALFKSNSNTEDKLLEKEKTLLKVFIKSFGITIHIVRHPLEGDIDNSGTIDKRESIFLGLALSMDAIGVSIGSALAGFSSMSIPLAIGMFQLCFLYIGISLGKLSSYFKNINTKFLSALPGFILILIAIIRILQ